jgi:hypothetical protein
MASFRTADITLLHIYLPLLDFMASPLTCVVPVFHAGRMGGRMKGVEEGGAVVVQVWVWRRPWVWMTWMRTTRRSSSSTSSCRYKRALSLGRKGLGESHQGVVA